jgi:integrase
MAKHKLSAAFVRNVTKQGLHGDGEGLYLQVTPALNGGLSKSWILRFTWGGKERKCGLGPLSNMGLAEARAEADRCRKLIGQGIDPVETRRTEKAAQATGKPKVHTFEACAMDYMAAKESEWTNAIHREQWRISLKNHVYPVIGRTSVHAVDLPAVLKVLQPIWQTKPETASRVRARVEAILDWAKVMKLRTGENPARWRGNLDMLLPKKSKIRKVEHFKAMPYEEVPAFVAELRAVEGTIARALEFTILAVARTDEVLGATWPEIDRDAKVWTIPPLRNDEWMKPRREHRVPLSPRAAEIVEMLWDTRCNDHVFPSDRIEDAPLSNAVMRSLLNEMRPGKEFTVHGFRSSFRDWAAEQTNFPREVCEAALSHASGDPTEDAYKRTDFLKKRRLLMEAWSQFITNPPTGNVVPLRSGEGAA